MTTMPDPRDPQEKLEELIHRALRDLPARRAPRSLEQRVLAELAQRAALAWWHKSFAYWPLPVRVAFIVASAGLVKVVLMATVWVMAGFDLAEVQNAFAQPVAWMEGGRAVSDALVGFCEIMLRNIPPLWLYGGLAFLAAMYAALFGLGAAAYKAFRAQR